ncbi:MAG: phosphoribosylaminoimidazolesuccinocarboxamide synthase [Syntrophobacterales bacterium]|nr:phosphoribosylaminoimidazolesuccinocarboxamide synthase [Syntrophobacterales bacterium]HNQ01010.1 phosphoribosylaminoimidazolesuccinocarboxamide synthase [Syntrophales bacterium]
MTKPALYQTDLEGLKLVNRGKVRDIYDLGEHLLIVATDRISAFDVIMPNPIPGKGEVLTKLSEFWFRQMADIVGNHLVTTDVEKYPPACRPHRDVLRGRSMLVRKAKPLPVECIVRGYITGSAWKDYTSGKPVSGIRLPAGLRESARLPEPIFTPSTKAPEGEHDLPISTEEMARIVGRDLTDRIIALSLAIYRRAEEIARSAGIIIADTKMEFGLADGELILIDEVLTPDSSRFWPRDDYAEGRGQKSFDKQFLRDYLLSLKWDQKPPAPHLPPEIIEKTQQKYEEALRRFTKKP